MDSNSYSVADTIPNKWYAKFAKNADIAIHECFMPPNLMMEKYGFSAAAALNVAVGVHTPPASFGKVMSDIKPRLAMPIISLMILTRAIPFRRAFEGPMTAR